MKPPSTALRSSDVISHAREPEALKALSGYS
jgi:hypothetical protein